MSDSLHIVCPRCETINRVPSPKLTDHPNCGKCKQKLFTGHPVELTSANFQKYTERNDIPVVADFWAAWCGPCKAMAPVFEQAAAQLEPRVRLAKVDTEREQALAARFGIQSIPTLAVFKNGREVARQAGAMPLPSLLSWIRKHV
jgi:thioredoxin 2